MMRYFIDPLQPTQFIAKDFVENHDSQPEKVTLNSETVTLKRKFN